MKTWAGLLAVSIGILTATAQSAHAKPHLLNLMGEACAPLRTEVGVDFNHVKPEFKEWVIISAKNLQRYFSRMLLIVQHDDTPAIRDFGLCYTITLQGEVDNA